jgi:hypothetical protein
VRPQPERKCYAERRAGLAAKQPQERAAAIEELAAENPSVLLALYNRRNDGRTPAERRVDRAWIHERIGRARWDLVPAALPDDTPRSRRPRPPPAAAEYVEAARLILSQVRSFSLPTWSAIHSPQLFRVMFPDAPDHIFLPYQAACGRIVRLALDPASAHLPADSAAFHLFLAEVGAHVGALSQSARAAADNAAEAAHLDRLKLFGDARATLADQRGALAEVLAAATSAAGPAASWSEGRRRFVADLGRLNAHLERVIVEQKEALAIPVAGHGDGQSGAGALLAGALPPPLPPAREPQASSPAVATVGGRPPRDDAAPLASPLARRHGADAGLAEFERVDDVSCDLLFS